MLFIILLIVLLCSYMIYNLLNFKSKRPTIKNDCSLKTDYHRTAIKLSKIIQCKTISSKHTDTFNWNEFEKLKDTLKENFPLVHKHLKYERINTHSLLYKWSGSADKKKRPILFLSHMDVVPIDEATLDEWIYPPFSGIIEDGFVWGRGAIDMKVQLTCILETIESLLEEGFVPNRDIYIALGHDEEVGGYNGAREIAKYLLSKGIFFDLILDEGGCISTEQLKNVSRPVAAVGTCEKGFCTIKLSCHSNGGHASMPPKHTSLGVLCKAIAKLEAHQMPLKLSKPVKEMLEYIGPEMDIVNRFLLSNIKIFRTLALRRLIKTSLGNSLLRTTTAATMAEASKQDNVLPSEASITLNFRILPGETYETLLNHVKKILKNNPHIEITVLRADNPSPISPSHCEAFKKIENAIYNVYPEVIVTPYLFVMGTDSRRYSKICENIYRFSPYMLSNEDLSGMHGINERVSLENIQRMLKFYKCLMKSI